MTTWRNDGHSGRLFMTKKTVGCTAENILSYVEERPRGEPHGKLIVFEQFPML